MKSKFLEASFIVAIVVLLLLTHVNDVAATSSHTLGVADSSSSLSVSKTIKMADKAANNNDDNNNNDPPTKPSSSSSSSSSTTKFSDNDKVNAIQSNWWHIPMQTFFPDKRFDGQFQNPDTEQVFDIDDVVMKADNNPFEYCQSHNVIYYPKSDNDKNIYTIFIPGLGQTEKTASQRSCRYAERLQTGIVNLNNGSFLKQNPIFKKINPLLDWLDATVHRLGLSGSYVIHNCATFVVSAMERKQVVNLSGDSHGTILLGRALWVAKKRYVKEKLRPRKHCLRTFHGQMT